MLPAAVLPHINIISGYTAGSMVAFKSNAFNATNCATALLYNYAMNAA